MILLDDLYLVDRHGEVFKKAEPRDQLDFPVLTGLDTREVMEREKQAVNLMRQALELLGILRQRKIFTPRDVSEIHLSKQNGLTIFTLKGGFPSAWVRGSWRIRSIAWKKCCRTYSRKSRTWNTWTLFIPRKSWSK